ncbi:nitroreductase family protein [Acinetobacter johnsonii]|jgi:predicted oxidoreductase (fatty acid repression mutant protein)|uniref:Nitroreductase family protein n=1 Tax=Acinetobacter johnsonii TaxID=40214 RepID=A0AAJ6IBS0_ACIJO|nr:nitroreductase family protein [Acinetobacter johnsonii]ALV72882.1 nitroreductase [Acinetobacter johnsonii XBB1]MBB4809766.1 putative oxidoreductase (fatty acid repression mutant protein) [Acinetobacter johnsonii]MDH1365053.1 nitroreductase family protein [Acinetobacter johnsonii]MDH1533937.1 nitroreductase family protein [Acinetobacter johnsonii]MDM1252392.1 nitroreductase family protein [Acinetobacter johnsonii]
MSFLDHIKQRRTIYAVGKNVALTPEQIESVIKEAVNHSPSAFNSQTSRIVTLFGESHLQFWNVVRETLRKIVPEAAFEGTNAKINSFAAGYGTVLFYEDQDVVKSLQEQFALYADNFPVWSEHSSAIAQFAVWTALSEQNIGASLQHYNPIVDAEIAEIFDIPANWKLRAQLVFGSIEAPAGEKTFMAEADRFKTFN